MKSFTNNIRTIFFVFICSFAVAGTFASCNKKLKTTELIITKADGNVLSVTAEMAVTPEEREYGFMERKKIPDGTGMIFIFEKDEVLRFWMKNTPTALSIAYIDRNGIIKEIFDMQPFSLEGIESFSSVRYALEVPKGWYAKNGIKPGDKIRLNF